MYQNSNHIDRRDDKLRPKKSPNFESSHQPCRYNSNRDLSDRACLAILEREGYSHPDHFAGEQQFP